MLAELHIRNLRNLAETHLAFTQPCNIIYGANGSGKTSLLESIYLLSLGRSFRTHLINRIIQHGTHELTLFGKVRKENSEIPIGLSRHRKGETELRLAGRTPDSITELTKALPVQVIHPESHRLLTDGPKLRRQFLDWGVFHVEHQFYANWQRFQRVLKQRNAAIKRQEVKSSVQLWNKEFLETALLLNKQRQQYFQQFYPLFEDLIALLLPQTLVKLHLFRGWNDELTLENTLNKFIDRDIELGYTQFGPQRADIRIKVDSIPAQDTLSQGQQKLVVYALRLAQGQLHHQLTASSPLYLVDDLPAELDINKRSLVMRSLRELDTQIFITGAEVNEMEDLLAADTQVFHVEHGHVEI